MLSTLYIHFSMAALKNEQPVNQRLGYKSFSFCMHSKLQGRKENRGIQYMYIEEDVGSKDMEKFSKNVETNHDAILYCLIWQS